MMNSVFILPLFDFWYLGFIGLTSEIGWDEELLHDVFSVEIIGASNISLRRNNMTRRRGKVVA